MNRITKIFTIALLGGSLTGVKAQDLHYADVQQMGQWYNPALKNNPRGEFNINFRDIRYQNMLSFRTGTALLSMPIGNSKDTTAASDKGRFNVSLGAAFDQTNTGFYKGTAGLLGLSYAQPLSNDGLFAAVGFQASLHTNKYGGSGTFPDQFNEYGPIQGAVTNDPLRSGNKYNYMSFHAGASLYQTGSSIDWYLGGSVRHLNRPFTENSKLDEFRLNSTMGLQGGFTMHADRSNFSAYGTGTWKGKASEILVGARYEMVLGDNRIDPNQRDKATLLMLGCAIRVKDALIPHVGLQYNRTRVALHYDMNTSSIQTSGFVRRGFELVLTQNF
jgi:type IX secretion system PorP/SprF family membrane protein